MSYKCYIIDDEPLAIDVIVQHLSQFDQLEVVGTATSPTKGYAAINSQPIDLLFVDIQMPGITGLELLDSMSTNAKVIITTAYREYALEGFELNVLDYLVKPIAFPRFFKAIDKFLQAVAPQEEQQEEAFIFVQVERKQVKLLLNDILYVEGVKDYVRIVTPTEKLLTKASLGIFLKRLPVGRFIRVHKSYVVNQSHITAYTNYDVELGGKEIPIGRAYKAEFIATMREKL